MGIIVYRCPEGHEEHAAFSGANPPEHPFYRRLCGHREPGDVEDCAKPMERARESPIVTPEDIDHA